MSFNRKSRAWGQILSLLFPLLLFGCSDDGNGPVEELAPLVGVWEATTLLMTNQANPDISVDLVDQGASFTLSILSTGQYSAVLSAFGGANTEAGDISVSGNQLTLTPTSPPGASQTSVWSFQGSSLVLDGESSFDFNQDGEPEPSFAYMVFLPLDL